MAIDTDEVGQKKLDELVKYMNDGSVNFTEYERSFLTRMRGAPYKWLTFAQKSFVGRLYEERVRCQKLS